VILNPFDLRAVRWDLFGEMSTIYDADQLAPSLIADVEGPESSWGNYARVFLTSRLRQLHRVKHHDVGELYSLITTTPVEDLRELLGDAAAGEREVRREQITKSRGGGPIFASDHRSVSTSTQHVTESEVLASEIEQLPDLQGFLKFASQPEWKRVKLAIPA
jgi:hypothetical protein